MDNHRYCQDIMMIHYNTQYQSSSPAALGVASYKPRLPSSLDQNQPSLYASYQVDDHDYLLMGTGMGLDCARRRAACKSHRRVLLADDVGFGLLLTLMRSRNSKRGLLPWICAALHMADILLYN